MFVLGFVAVGTLSVTSLSGCSSTSPLTIEEARQLAVELEDTVVASPPRSLVGLGELPFQFDDVADAPACVIPSEQLTPTRLDEITSSLSQTEMGGRHVLLARKAIEQQRAGHLSNAILFQRESIRQTPRDWFSNRGRHHLYLSRLLAEIGDFGEAESHYDSGRDWIRRARPDATCLHRDNIWLNRTNGAIAYSKGDLVVAEADFRAARLAWGETWGTLSENCVTMISDKAEILLDEARVIFWQGRFGEAETLARESHQLSRKVRPQAALLLSEIYFESGRYQDSLRLALSAIAQLDRLCVPVDAFQRARAYAGVARAFIGLERWRDASQMYERLERLLTSDRLLWEARFQNDLNRGIALLRTGKPEDALVVFRARAVSMETQLGTDSYLTLESQALAAAALAEIGQHTEARETMRRVFFKMVERWRDSAGDSVRFVGRLARMRMVGEAYLQLLLDSDWGGATGDPIRIAESFQVADAVATRGVQRALAESTARNLTDNAETQDLIRQQQDLARQILGLRHRLNVATFSTGVSAKSIQELRNQVGRAENAERILEQQIAELVPEYVALTNPSPVELVEAREVLREGETLVLIFPGRYQLYVWALPKKGPALTSVVELGYGELKLKVDLLRKALAPDITTLGDIPEYDLELGYGLFRMLLQPVAAAWQGQKRLLIVADGPLGALPFAVLPTEEVALAPDRSTLFDSYRQVPWLARRISISRLPSASALIALRGTPIDHSNRHPFIGFGDPWFNPDAELVAESTSGAMRGGALVNRPLKMRSLPQTRAAETAVLASLPRLPDTADEVLAIAQTLGANLDRDVYLGESASERRVKELNDNGELKQYRTLSFATHGLVPGDLDGLEKPALAMASPTLEDAALGDDGLLTSDEILGLRLNADWAVLSACNTAAADGAGAETVSGLGRAFFYAGAKAILVSNWPVYSDATRALMIELFQTYSANGNQGRAVALRSAMLYLIDQGGYEVNGQLVFSYAHPIFWAPFMVVGDGG